jgi:hypothetical protein
MGEHLRPSVVQVLDIAKHPLTPAEDPRQRAITLDEGAAPPPNSRLMLRASLRRERRGSLFRRNSLQAHPSGHSSAGELFDVP